MDQHVQNVIQDMYYPHQHHVKHVQVLPIVPHVLKHLMPVPNVLVDIIHPELHVKNVQR